jgi:ATP-binding cassette, subfamily B, bacterial HlyB/CyaB
VALTVAIIPIFRSRLDEKFRRSAENQSFLVEAVASVETVKSMAIEPQMQRRWEEQLAGYVGASFTASDLGNWTNQAVTLISKLSSGAILWFGAHAVMRGDLTVGELCAFNMLAQRVTGPVLRLAQMWQDFQQTRISIARVGDIMNAASEPSGQQSRAALPAIRGDIRFDRVIYRYRPEGQPVLREIDLRILPGQVVGIVGPSGSGKSTLMKLMQRLYVPESGRVLVDGVDLALVDAAWLRRQIGVVLQENVLFNRTIRENIAVLDPAMPMERVMAAARLAGAHDFIVELAEGYDAMVGERGTSLSGGQRQRIAIARAIIGDPRILIFDEATSALDYESERAIQSNMRQICQGRTVLIIAHRLSTVRHADRIITVERGQVVEDGTHHELLRQGGRYAALHRVQAGEVIHEAV